MVCTKKFASKLEVENFIKLRQNKQWSEHMNRFASRIQFLMQQKIFVVSYMLRIGKRMVWLNEGNENSMKEKKVRWLAQ